MQEGWKDIPKLQGKYQVSNLGRVRQLEHTITYKTGRQVHKEYKIVDQKDYDGEGYMCVSIPKYSLPNVHKLVATAFLPNPHNFRDVDHLDGNPSNNAVTNLEWVSHQENVIRFQRRNPDWSRRRPCKCIETDELFPSYNAAEKAYGLWPCAVRRSILGKRTVKGYTFINITEEQYKRLKEK